MSEVAVSPAAAALHCLAGIPRVGPGVRRSLFGPLDHGELRRELRGRLQELAEDARERWGFDFQAERPVAGARLQWEPVCGSAVPAFYREKDGGSRGLRPEGAEDSVRPDGSVDAGSGCVEGLSGQGNNQENRCLSVRAEGSVKRGAESADRITDFFPKRKRTMETKVPCELEPSPGRLIPVEQTPRKSLR
ncbi:cyclin-dependent kinase inhibitor 1C [Ambystoma mexicanum]|uniref:Cyclin-dependent kinase inhibitor 1C n=2 Tax=Ambystoma TaxID=8295 RepID=A0A873AGB0_AMBME|nr:cyclin-dependent kinase inhibitor 1C [Ambystoma mexicanum]QOY46851.1 cyclin-dependent kinase inhibitor 1C [Ambystoma andersoni]